MKFWLSKSSEVPLIEQLTTQVVLGIVSADLAPGEQLPSTSELARRFHIHPNTVRAAYRNLVKEKWVDWRPGSGFYVRALNTEAESRPELELDRLISTFLRHARDRGYSLAQIQSNITRWFSLQPPDHILVIEPEIELRRILVAEISQTTPMPVKGISLEESSSADKILGGFSVALYDSAKDIQPILSSGVSCLFLHSRSVAKSLTGEVKPAADRLITVASRWYPFLHWARTILVAADIHIAAIDLRDARKKGWEKGLRPRDFIITDSLLAQHLPRNCKPVVFRIISDESLEELKALLKMSHQQ